MSRDADTIDMTGAREVYKLLDELEGHINAPGYSGASIARAARSGTRVLFFPLSVCRLRRPFELTAAVHAVVEDPSHRIEGVLECAGSRVSDFGSKPLCQLRLYFTLTAVCSSPH